MKKLLMKTWTNSNGPLLLAKRQTSLRKPLISLEFLKLLLQDFFSFFSVNHGLLVNCRFPYTLLVDSKQPQCSPQIEFIFSNHYFLVKLALNNNFSNSESSQHLTKHGSFPLLHIQLTFWRSPNWNATWIDFDFTR